MLGDGKSLKWRFSPDGLVVELPSAKPCKCAWVLKIECASDIYVRPFKGDLKAFYDKIWEKAQSAK